MTYKAPDYLEDDPWFGPAILSEKQRALRIANSRAVAEKMFTAPTKEVDNIHEVMYNIATSGGKTTTQLNPMPELGGGSENFQSGPGGWMSGTGHNQFHRGR